nr:hypothetical protein BaRGS_001820 [Batillaria attramentaria]
MAGSAVRTADVKHRPRDLTDDRLLFDFLMNRQPHSKKPSRLSTYQFTNCGDPKKELGNYSLPGVSLDLDIGILPSGGYKAKFDFEMSTAPVGCYEIRFDLD